MKKKKILALLLAASVATTTLAVVGCGGGETLTPLAANNKIYLVGDSTVCSFSDPYFLPRYGYGTQLYNYINCEESQIENLALSGRSSKSFLTEANYQTLKNSISSGDYLIIGFGHNDEKSDEDARYTDATGTYTEATTANGDSFQYVLYKNYIKLAKDNGATPILCTPIVRYKDTGAYTGAIIHDTTASDKLGKGGNYAQAIRDLGAATETTVVDLTTITKDIYSADNAAAAYYHAHTTYEEAKHTPLTGSETPFGRDDTHINKYGAKMVAYQFANAINSTGNTLKNHIREDIAAPTKDVDYADAVNLNFVKIEYAPFDGSEHAANLLIDLGDVKWYKTVFGDVGGATKLDTYDFNYEAGTFTLGNNGNNGKFSDGVDGLGAAFIQIDANKNFTASATVKVKSLSSSVSNQSGFGLMLRDDIHINKYDKTINSNFVATGALASGGGAIFSHEGGKIKKEGNATTVAADLTVNVSIERIGQTVNVSYADGTNTYTKTYTDFDFVAVDNDYMYLCLFANRGIMCEFTNVQFAITGDAQGA